MPSALTQPATGTCTWTSPTTACSTATTAGHWLVVVQLKLNTVPATTTTYTITWTEAAAVMGTPPFTPTLSISFSVPSTSTAGTQGFFSFDSGATDLGGGTVFSVSVQ